MFVRAKTVKGNQYAYLVVNEWKKGKVRQKVKKYLGRVVALPDKTLSLPLPTIDFSRPARDCIRDIIAFEFLRHGFIRKRETLIKNGLKISFATGVIQEEGKDVVLFLNDRYFHRRLLDDLQDFYQPEDPDETPGTRLAKAFSDAGIPIQKEWFVQLYKKIYLRGEGEK